MDAFVLLADAAQVTPGSSKVNALGLNWNITGPVLPPSAIVVLLRAAPEEAGEHTFELRLEDADGRNLQFDDDTKTVERDEDASRPILVSGTIMLGQRGEKEAADLPITGSIVVGVAANLPLPPGRYAWSVNIDGRTEDRWRVPFAVRSRALADEPED